MQTRSFTKMITILSVLLLVIIIGFSFTLLSLGPRVRQVSFDSPPETSQLTKGTVISIKFDRAIEAQDYTDLISFEPRVKFSASTYNQEIALTIQENFLHNSNYKLKLEPGVTDTTGRVMEENFTYDFLTAKALYTYLTRGNKPNIEEIAPENDIIYQQTSDQARQIIYENTYIRSFAINQNYLLVAEYSEATDNLVLINLENNAKTNINLPYDSQVNKIVMSPRGNLALVIIEPDFSSVSPELYERTAKRLYSVNFSNGEMQQLTNQEGGGVQASDVFISPDGQLAIYKQYQTNDFYLTSAFNDITPVLIGAHEISFGFDQTGSRVYFSNRGRLSELNLADSSSKNAHPNLSDYSVVDAQTRYIYSMNQVFESVDKGQTSFLRAESIDQKFTDVWNFSSNNLVDRFSVSYDSTLIAAELNPSDCEFENIGLTRFCDQTTIEIYDVNSKKVIDEIFGSNLIWNP